MKTVILVLLLGGAAESPKAPEGQGSPDGPWLRPGKAGDPLIWGRRDGIIFGLPSPGGLPGPRGLIRTGIVDPARGPILINFIAFEPVVAGKGKGFSELEGSALDGRRGKRLRAEGPVEGVLATENGVEALRVTVACEAFANGARVEAEARVRADRPGELVLSVTTGPESASVAQATLTATMGNYGRMRRLWLARRQVSSLDLYAGYGGTDFVEKEPFLLADLARAAGGDVWAALRSDEDDPASVPIPGAPAWQYRGPPLTQYWRVPAVDVEPDLHVRVNGRRVYWASKREIPGGPSFENFEVRQRYRRGQRFIFGLTRERPEALAPWRPDDPPHPAR